MWSNFHCRRSSDTLQFLLLLNPDKKVKFGSFSQNVNLGTVQKRKPYLNDLCLLSYYTKSGKTKTLGSGKSIDSRRFESIFSYVQQWKQKDQNEMKHVNAIEKNQHGSDETPCFDILLV